jgi:hypothetical protein
MSCSLPLALLAMASSIHLEESKEKKRKEGRWNYSI